METKVLHPDREDEIEYAGKLLREGNLVAIPTETVYGLAANALNGKAVKEIFAVKGRPSDNPLIVHISERDEILPLVKEVPEKAKRLMEAFWPGPLTIILKKTDIVPLETTGNLDTVAVRFPENEIARRVIKAAGVPLAAPSANLSGEPSPTEFKYVYEDLEGRVPAVIDGGDCAVGVESTVITLATEKPRLLRPGGITPEMIESVIGEIDIDKAVTEKMQQGAKVSSPGMKYKHYSPDCSIIIADVSFNEYVKLVNESDCDGALCFEGEEKYLTKKAVTYGKCYDGLSQAHRLFSALKELDEMGLKKVYARCPQKRGVGLAVYNRLIRSAGYSFYKNETKVIGLTGTTGSGKSTVCKELIDAGFSIIDCDKLTKSGIYEGECLEKLVNFFGKGIIDEKGELLRKNLAAAAFSTKENTLKLNEITHPYIMAKIKEEIENYKEKGARFIVLDAPTLFEAEADKLCTKIISVISDKELRLQRIIKRDGIDKALALKRISAQKDDSFYIERSDYVIKNDGDISALFESVQKAVAEITL
ncbi:MAG: threonylcarbamoyl-AMP synthase [Clostridia bacterium]|nr:threonylcarbamoyl-AMP synthase [Clostridia bacterium]